MYHQPHKMSSCEKKFACTTWLATIFSLILQLHTLLETKIQQSIETLHPNQTWQKIDFVKFIFQLSKGSICLI